MTGRVRALTATATLLIAFARFQPVRAATIWVYPGSAPCDTTLQACLDNASSGDEVLLDTNTLINEQATIQDKSLTLKPETGFSPSVASLVVRTQTATSPVGVLVSHVQVAHTLFVQLNSAPGTAVTLDHVTAQSSGADPGIYGIIYVGSTVNILHSSVTQAGFYPGIELSSPSAGHEDLSWNVKGNRISGALASMTQAGIYLTATDAGSLQAAVDSNAIWNEGQGVTSGDHGGIVLFGRSSSNVHFDVVGNTMAKIHGVGVLGDDELSSPNRFGLDLFNDIVANTSGAAVALILEPGSTGPFALHGGHNDLYANAQPDRLLGGSVGPHLTVPPRFTHPNTGNLQLKASSPVIDRGVTCSPGGVSARDAADLNRLFGPSVDIGAYEWNAGPPGRVEVGTNGHDVLTGGPRTDILCGNGGNDVLIGNGGSDFLNGGRGNDRLYGGPGRDRLFGDLGNDLLCARDGSPGDYLDGGRGTDSYRADPTDVKVSVERPGNCAR